MKSKKNLIKIFCLIIVIIVGFTIYFCNANKNKDIIVRSFDNKAEINFGNYDCDLSQSWQNGKYYSLIIDYSDDTNFIQDLSNSEYLVIKKDKYFLFFKDGYFYVGILWNNLSINIYSAFFEISDKDTIYIPFIQDFYQIYFYDNRNYMNWNDIYFADDYFSLKELCSKISDEYNVLFDDELQTISINCFIDNYMDTRISTTKKVIISCTETGITFNLTGEHG